MNKHLAKILFYIRGISTQGKQWFLELSRPKQIGVGVVTLLVLLMVVRSFGSTPVVKEVAKAPRSVKLERVSDLMNNESALPLLGTITSTSEATIRTESSGKLTRVYKKLGDYVVAGQVIAEFENSGERAAVLQAEGAYESAKAGRDIARINTGTTNSSLGDTKTNALNTISSAYINMDHVIHVKTDAAFVNPRSADVHLALSISDASLTYSLESRRQAIEKMLLARDVRNRTLTVQSDLLSEIVTVQSEVQTIKTYLDDLATAYAKALVDTSFSQTAIDGGKALVGGARSTISGTVNALTSTRTALTASIAAQEVAGKTTATDTTAVTTADASVKSALGAYNGALSRLEKTVVRSPITGTLNSLSIATGDFVSAFTEIAVVSNNGALEVLSYVTEDDAKRVTVGSPVVIDGSAKGIVTRVASAIDPRTKKIEVRVGITDKQSTLVNGQSVRVEVARATSTSKVTTTQDPVKVPISALKLTPKGSLVFTTSASSTLVAIPVEVGAILGEEIQILSGITGDTNIVTDARGLKEGMTVIIQE